MNELITSGRKRRARALELELDEALNLFRSPDEDPPDLLEHIAELRAAITATRDEPDDFVCFGCGTDVDPNDPEAGGAYFTRMSRHDESDKVVVKGGAELKYCGTCYSALHAAMTGLGVAEERESIKAARRQKAEAPDHEPGRQAER